MARGSLATTYFRTDSIHIVIEPGSQGSDERVRVYAPRDVPDDRCFDVNCVHRRTELGEQWNVLKLTAEDLLAVALEPFV